MKEKIGFECVLPSEEDAALVMQWRNDPITRQMSLHTELKKWETFYKEFLDNYFNFPDLPPLFILLNDKRAAFVYFEPTLHPENILARRCVEISINVAPEQRGKGLGTAALKALKDWIALQGYDDIYAIIKEENAASKKIFQAAGYERLENGFNFLEDSRQNIPICRFIARLTPPKKESVFVIAEAGSNWRIGSPQQDWEMARTLIDIAADAKADAVKFQVFRPETIYVANAGKSGYLSEMGIERDMQEMFADLAMPYEMIAKLHAYCQKVGIEFMATPFSKNDFLAIDPFVNYHKIGSYEIGHIRLIELIARTGKPTFISTGAATEDEIAWAVDTFHANGGKDLTLMQCTAKYPAEADSINLRTIPWLKNRFRARVGLSDHSLDWQPAPLAAVALGAQAIEKHFTVRSDLPGPDHAFALTPDELKKMVSAIRQTELMLGSYVKSIHPSEEELRSFARRGIQALRSIEKGEILTEGLNIDILRPGQQTLGMHPKFITQMEGKKAARSIALGSGIQWGDWE